MNSYNKKIQYVRCGAALMSLFSAFLPFFAQAAPGTFSEVVYIFVDLIQTAIPIIASIALLVFIWGLIRFINSAGDAKSHEGGRQLMVWGSVGLFVLVTLWGILGFLSQQFEFGGSAGIPSLPE
jgi:hypothetical protein